MDALTNLNNAISQLQQHAAIDGITVAGLAVTIFAVIIMFNNDNSPQARAQKWEHIHRVLLCAMVVAAAGVLVQAAVGFGHML